MLLLLLILLLLLLCCRCHLRRHFIIRMLLAPLAKAIIIIILIFHHSYIWHWCLTILLLVIVIIMMGFAPPLPPPSFALSIQFVNEMVCVTFGLIQNNCIVLHSWEPSKAEQCWNAVLLALPLPLPPPNAPWPILWQGRSSLEERKPKNSIFARTNNVLHAYVYMNIVMASAKCLAQLSYKINSPD